MRRARASRLLGVGVAALGVLVAGCGGSGFKQPPAPGPPVGHPVMPDLAPLPPSDVRMSTKDGRWYLSFSSTMVNVGHGAFLLRATRENGRWSVVEDIPYSKSGAKPVPLVATLVWGGDGHNHWHIARIAVTILVRLDAQGRPERSGGRIDSKAGFCFYDYSRWHGGPAKPVFSRLRCGHEKDGAISMGLSPGWADKYPWVLPGQSIDVTGLRDGTYRLWAIVDQRGWFRESTRSNDRTWVDLKLSTRGKLRYAQVLKVGPKPKPS